MERVQIECLSEALRCANKRGLERQGNYWVPSDGGKGFHANTVACLVAKGLLRLWGGGEVAHITQTGEIALSQIVAA